MKVMELINLLRTPVGIEFRVNNSLYAFCESRSLLTEELGEREIDDWFVCWNGNGDGRNRICINLKPQDNNREVLT